MTKTNKNIFDSKKKDIIKGLLELKRRNKAINSKIKTKKYYNYDDIEYKGIRDVKNTIINQ